jgi:hypothetical protein
LHENLLNICTMAKSNGSDSCQSRKHSKREAFQTFRDFQGLANFELAKGQTQSMALIFDPPCGNSSLRKWMKYRGDRQNGLAIGNHLKSRDHSRNSSSLHLEIFSS